MQYEAYIRPVEGAKTAALLIHGIVGTPAHFKDLLGVIPEDWSVYNILLDGHGKQVKDFARTSMTKWKAQVSAQLDEILKTHEQVLIIAHSMGTLFAIDEAIKRPGQVKALFLLAVPLTPRVRFRACIDSFLVTQSRIKPGSSAEAMFRDCGVKELSPRLWKYIPWIPRFWELIVEVRRTIRKLPRLETPTRTYQSYTDELVGRGSIRYLQNHKHISNTVLHGSGHFCYDAQDTKLLQAQLKELTDQLP